MTADAPDADAVADLVLPLDGPYQPDQVIEAARTVAELVRRLNFATRRASALRYPPQVDRTLRALRFALSGLNQTFTQIASRLDALGADPGVEHDDHGDPAATSAEAADHLRYTAAELGVVTTVLDRATAITNHLGYDTSTARTRRQTFPPPGADTTVHEGQPRLSTVPPSSGISTGVNPPPRGNHERRR